MNVVAERMSARDRPAEQLQRLFAGGWPEFIFHDRLAAKFHDRVRSRCPNLELVLRRRTDDELVAAGWAVPLRWSGDPGDLPAGYADCLAQSWHDMEQGTVPDTLVIMAAQVRSDLTGQGLAGRLLTAFRPTATETGLDRIIAPVRPTRKSRYPLTPIEEYATWARPDGEPFDPWVRTHTRLGARVIGIAPESETITGSITEWESWTDMPLPASGDYVIPGGLSVLKIDTTTDSGIYIEPNIWLQHA